MSKPKALNPSLVGASGLVAKGAAQPVAAATIHSTAVHGTLTQAPPNGAATPAGSFRAETDGAGRLAGRVLRVAIALVHDNPYNARRLYSPEVIKDRAASIAAEGQKVPAAAVRHPDRAGEFILVDGQYRKRALQFLGRTEIDILLEEALSDKDLYRLSRLYNKQRNDGSAYDDALVWHHMLANKVVADQDELADLAGVSKSVMSKTLGLLKLPEPVLQRIQDRPQDVGPAMGYELYLLSKLAPHSEVLRVLEQVFDGTITTKDVESLRARIEQGVARKPKELSRQYKIRSGPAQIGFLKEWDSGKVSLEVRVLDAKERLELVEELKRRFGLSEAATQMSLPVGQD
jgi:ParB family chromosome partitioning protein